MKNASYGTWESPITADLLSEGDTPVWEVKVHVRSSSILITAQIDEVIRSLAVRSITLKAVLLKTGDLVLSSIPMKEARTSYHPVTMLGLVFMSMVELHLQ